MSYRINNIRISLCDIKNIQYENFTIFITHKNNETSSFEIDQWDGEDQWEYQNRFDSVVNALLAATFKYLFPDSQISESASSASVQFHNLESESDAD